MERRAVVLDEDHPVAVESVTAEPVGGVELRTGDEVRVRLKYRTLRSTDALWGFSIWTGDQCVCVTGGLDTTALKNTRTMVNQLTVLEVLWD